MKLKAASIGCIALTALLLLGGCSAGMPEGTGAVLDKQEIKEDTIYFYAVFLQQQMKDALGTKYSDDIWQQQLKEGGPTYLDDVRDSALRDLEELYLVRAWAREHKISLTAEEKKEIEDTTDSFLKANSKKTKDKCFANKTTVQEFLTLLKLEKKCCTEIVPEDKVKISDDDARQKKYSYVFYSTHKQETDKDGNILSFSDKEIEEVNKKAEALLKDASSDGDFERAAKAAGQELKSQVYGDQINLHKPLQEALSKLKDGEFGPVVKTEPGIYVIRMDTVNDKEATKARKAEMVKDKQVTQYRETLKGWVQRADFQLNKDLWKDVDSKLPEDLDMNIIREWIK